MSWRKRRDARRRTCFLSNHVDTTNGRYLVHRHDGDQWELAFDRVGAAALVSLGRGSLESLQAEAFRHALGT